ncbi:g7775 [Coccomyxa elongata]
MADEYAPYARLSNAAYYPGKAAELVKATGYLVYEELSNRNRTTFYHPDTKKAVVAFRGTNPRDPSDLLADFLIARGQTGLSTRFKTSASTVRKANKKYGKDMVSVTGHSLGGSQALDVNRRLGNPAYAFNPGSGVGGVPLDILKGAFTTPAQRKKSTATIVATPGDLISASALFGPERKILVKPRYTSTLKRYNRKALAEAHAAGSTGAFLAYNKSHRDPLRSLRYRKGRYVDTGGRENT